jgi:hypothetical protein
MSLVFHGFSERCGGAASDTNVRRMQLGQTFRPGLKSFPGAGHGLPRRKPVGGRGAVGGAGGAVSAGGINGVRGINGLGGFRDGRGYGRRPVPLLSAEPYDEGSKEKARKSSVSQPLLRQLREAVLNSLDVSDAQMSGDWSDIAEKGGSNGGSLAAKLPPPPASLWDTLNSQANSTLQSGKATFEVLRIDEKGGTRLSHVRRRDLIRQYNLPPRDLRTMDGSITSSTKSNMGINCKDDCILINIGGVRAFLTMERVLLFEPHSQSSKKFVEILCAKLKYSHSPGGGQGIGKLGIPASTIDEDRDRLMLGAGDNAYYSSGEGSGDMQYLQYTFPFELVRAATRERTGDLPPHEWITHARRAHSHTTLTHFVGGG